MELNAWLREMTSYLISAWGLEEAFAAKAALLYLYLHYYGLSPVITSGWRSPEKQEELFNRYQQGDPTVIVKPALKSLHLNTKLGKPASLAIDISTSNHALAGAIGKALGIRSGYFFKTPDPVHFDAGKPT